MDAAESPSPDSSSSSEPLLQRCIVPNLESEDGRSSPLCSLDLVDLASVVPQKKRGVFSAQAPSKTQPAAKAPGTLKAGPEAAPGAQPQQPLSKMRLYNKPCPTPGCAGLGHALGKFRSHYTVAACPLANRVAQDEDMFSMPPSLDFLSPVGTTEIYGGVSSSSCGSSDPSLSASSPKDTAPELLSDPSSPEHDDGKSGADSEGETAITVVVRVTEGRGDEEEEADEEEGEDGEEYVQHVRSRRRITLPIFRRGASVHVSNKCKREDIAGKMGVIEGTPTFSNGNYSWYTVHVYTADGGLAHPLPVKVRSSDLTLLPKALQGHVAARSPSASSTSSHFL